jgi:hypothetical protein
VKPDHIKSDLCDGTLESCSDPDHLPYDEMRSEMDRITLEQERQEPGSSDDIFQITELKEKLSLTPYNINDNQILYQLVVVIKSKVINTIVSFSLPHSKANNNVLYCGPWCQTKINFYTKPC